MAGLRVRLAFPDDEKYWLFVDLVKIKTIQDLIHDIEDKYSVICEKLLLDDAQLYCKETVSILQDKDLVRVTLKVSKKRKKLIEDSQKGSGNSPGLLEEVEKSPPYLKPKKKKKCKQDKALEEDLYSDSSSIKLVTEAPVVEKQRKAKNTVRETEEKKMVVEKQMRMSQHVAEPEIKVTILENVPELDTKNKEQSAEGGAKRRRRRRRKSHHKSEEVDNSSLFQTVEAQHDYIPNSPKERQHVRFNEDSGDNIEPETYPADIVTTGFGNHMKNGSNSVDRANHISSEDAKTTETTKFVKSFVYQNPSTTSSPVVPQLGALLSLRSAVFSRNSYEKSTTHNYNSVPPPESCTSSEALQSTPRVSASLPVKAPLKLDPTTFPVIKGLPRVNDLIAFKVLELSENYNPELSDYMQGRITHMSPSSDITVQLLDPKPKRHSRGKFELIEQTEEELEEDLEIEYESIVTYQWSEMIDPRLIFP